MKSPPINPIDLAGIILTVSDAKAFCEDSNRFTAAVSTNSVQESIEKIFSYQQAKILSKLLKTYNITEKDTLSVKAFFLRLIEEISRAPQVSLTIAFSPQRVLLHMISSWLILNFQTLILIHVVVDESIVGGAIIEYNGVYKDYSLRKSLTEFYNQTPQKTI